MSEFYPISNETSEENSQEYPSFDEHRSNVEVPEHTPETEPGPKDVEPNNRQQEKILTYLIGVDPTLTHSKEPTLEDIINSKAENPIEAFNVDSTRISDFKSRLRTGELGVEAKKKEFLAHINPGTTAEDWTAIKHDSSLRGIFATAEWGDFSKRDDNELWPNDKLVDSFRQKYPTPLEYEPFIENFLNQIEAQNGPEKRVKYEQASKEFRAHMYGKQNEYYDQMRLLAEQQPPETKKASAPETPAEATPATPENA